jgi:DNA-binding PadR family transcriptional regulator
MTEEAAPPGKITTLGYALLGLIGIEPRSGYALRRQFEITPMGRYSSSPGSIYPALAGLERAELAFRSSMKSGKAQYDLTGSGWDALIAWLDRPVTMRECEADAEAVILRFAMMAADPDVAKGHKRAAAFLEGYEQACRDVLNGLESYLRSPEGLSLPTIPRLAMERGCTDYRGQIDWARDSIVTLRNGMIL